MVKRIGEEPTITETVRTTDDAVISSAAEPAKTIHCKECSPSKSGYTLDSSVFDDKTGKLTHHFVSEKGEFLDEPCGGSQ